MKLETPKGTRDFEPDEKRRRDSLISTLKQTFERFGFNPLETPIMEKMEVLSSKFTGGSEILKETYSLKDQGGRDLGLRYDLTVPLARFVGSRPNLKMPFKRYQIGPVFRDGPIKAGRLRQFYQCDVDVVGSNSMLADAECIKVAFEVFEQLGIDVKIRVNSRKLLNAMVKNAGIPDDKFEAAMVALDKLEKFGKEEVLKEMKGKGIDGEELLNLALSSEAVAEEFSEDEGYKEVQEVLCYVSKKNLIFTPSLARGLAYYTGTVFEVFSEGIDSSLAAGGRYDNMIGDMIGNGSFPAVGISFGIEPISEVLRGKGEKSSTAKVLVIGIGVVKEALETAAALRAEGINTDSDVIGRGISKNLDYANSYNIPYVVIIGKKELEQGKFTLKDMTSGEERLMSLGEIVDKLSG